MEIRAPLTGRYPSPAPSPTLTRIASPHAPRLPLQHGSDSVESAKKEIALWFAPGDLTTWTHPQQGWIYE